MKYNIHIYGLIGNIIGLIYTFFRMFRATLFTFLIMTEWSLTEYILVYLPFGLCIGGIIIGLLFLFFQRFLIPFIFFISLSAVSALFLSFESLYRLIFDILPNGYFYMYISNPSWYFLTISPIIYFVIMCISIKNLHINYKKIQK